MSYNSVILYVPPFISCSTYRRVRVEEGVGDANKHRKQSKEAVDLFSHQCSGIAPGELPPGDSSMCSTGKGGTFATSYLYIMFHEIQQDSVFSPLVGFFFQEMLTGCCCCALLWWWQPLWQVGRSIHCSLSPRFWAVYNLAGAWSQVPHPGDLFSALYIPGDQPISDGVGGRCSCWVRRGPGLTPSSTIQPLNTQPKHVILAPILDTKQSLRASCGRKVSHIGTVWLQLKTC